MPVDLLLVEGKLDAIVLSPLMGPQVTIERVGGKGSLKPKARDRRQEKQVTACYLRDRDFDYDPPDACTAPIVDAQDASAGSARAVLGWHWCRHEMESYLLEPRLVEMAVGWKETDYAPLLLDAAQRIRAYTAARWAVGLARRSLVRLWELPTRPSELTNEIKLPDDCSESTCFAWARQHVAEFLAKVQRGMDPAVVDAALTERAERLTCIATTAEALLWYSGKDLLAALAPRLPQSYRGHPKVFVRDLQDWVRSHPEEATTIHPEWQALKLALQTG